MPWALLANKWLWIGLLIAGLASFGQYERWQAQRYQAIAEAEKERVKALGVEIETQNAAVDALKKAGDDREKAVVAAVRAVQARAGVAESEAARLRGLAGAARPTARPAGCPPSGADTAVQAIRDGLK